MWPIEPWVIGLWNRPQSGSPKFPILGGLNVLPGEDLVIALVRACGGDQDEAQRWAAARRRIAAATPPSPAAPADAGGRDRDNDVLRARLEGSYRSLSNPQRDIDR